MLVDFTDFYNQINPKFWRFFRSRARVRLSWGGAGSSKSYTEFQDVIYKLVAEPGHNFLICRKVANTSKTSTYALFKQIINNLGLTSVFTENKTDLTFTVKATGYMAIFKGLDDIEKIKSFTFPNGILTDIVVEEASEITQNDFNQLNIRLRGKKVGDQAKIPFQITLMWNPIHNKHWLKREFFDLRSYQKDKIGKNGKKIKGLSVFEVHSTYLDNNFLDEDDAAILEGYKDIDYEFYRVYCLGEWGAYGNIIFSNWSFGKPPCSEDGFDAIYNGQDFGFVHPQVIVKIGFKDGVMYTYNELCLFEKHNKECIEANDEFDILHKGEQIICDSEAPDKIKEWAQHGYGAIGAKKGKGSVLRGIDFLKAQKWVIDDDRCPRTAQEVQTYHRKEDKDGNALEDPVELFDDAIKAHMYALEPLSRLKGKPSVMTGVVSEGKKGILEVKKAERKKMREVLKAQRRGKREARREAKNKS